MRIRLVILGLLTLLLQACSHWVREVESLGGSCHALEEVDSIMWRQPDSAFSLLMAFADSEEANCLDEFNEHYCQLLISELLYKNDYAQSNRDALLRAVDYFDANDDVFLDARVHYIKGVGYYQMDSVALACKEYLKALELMKENYGKEELVGVKAHFMTYVFNRLGDMFSNQFMMESAIICYKNACAYSFISPISDYSISNALYRIGKQFDKKAEFDSASYYYSRAVEELSDTNHIYFRDIVASQTLLSYQLTHQAEKPIRQLKRLAVMAENDDEKQTRYFVIGGVYFEEGKYDSALVYLESVFENTENVVSRIQAAQYLQMIYDTLGFGERSDECMRFLAQQKKSEGTNKALVSQLNDLFQNHLKKEQKKLAEKEREQSIRKTVAIVVPIAILVAIAFLVLVKHRNNQELRKLKDQIKQQNDLATSAPTVSFPDEPICRLIMERVKEGAFKSQFNYHYYKNYALDKNQLTALCKAVNCHFNGFTTRLKKAYPSLTFADLEYCCLYLLGLSDADVSALMQKAYPTVSQRSRKIKAILGNEMPLSISLCDFAGNDLFY